VLVLGRRALVDLATVGIALAALVALVGVKRLPEPMLIAAAGGVGLMMTGTAAPRGEGDPAGRAPAPVVVFVCEHGSAKSLVAASLFERLARERGLVVKAVSRGTDPDAEVPAGVVEALRGDGFDVSAFRPEALTAADARSAARVVAIGVDLSEAASAGGRVESWSDIPPVSSGYPAARAALMARIEVLLRGLEADGVARRDGAKER
jgi:arsenate reductase (thioredoxin)